MNATPAASAADPILAGRAWIVPALAVAIVVAVALLLWPTSRSLHLLWTDTQRLGYTHGYLIGAVSLGLLARDAREFDVPRPDWRFVPLLAAAGLAWLVLYRAGLELPHQLLLPMLAFAALATAFGLANARRAWFPFAYLYFAMSIWDYANGVLQSLTVSAVRLMLGLSGVPVFVEGTVLNIPEGSFVVDPGCSGLHFFVVALAFAALFGELHRDSAGTRTRQLLLAVALALFSNWLRVYCVALAGHLTDMQHYLVRVEHYTFGWVIFALSMAAFFWIASRSALREAPPRVARGDTPPATLRRVLVSAGAGLAALALGPLLAAFAPARAAAPGVALPVLTGWSGPNLASGSWRPSFPHADRTALATYYREGVVVAAFSAEFDDQYQGKELVGFGNSLFNGLAERAENGALVTAHGAARWRGVSDAQGREGVVAYYYRIGTARRSSGMAAQLNYGAASLLGPVRSGIVAVMADCVPDCQAASAHARDLLDAIDSARQEHP